MAGLAGMPIGKFTAALAVGSVPIAFALRGDRRRLGRPADPRPRGELRAPHPPAAPRVLSHAPPGARQRARRPGSQQPHPGHCEPRSLCPVPRLPSGLSGTLEGYMALLLASTGCLVAVVGAALVFRSRIQLGSHGALCPWQMMRRASSRPGPIDLSGTPSISALPCSPWARRSHSKWPAALGGCRGIVPTFVRALAEEKLLTATFGEHYTRYREQIKMIIPRLQATGLPLGSCCGADRGTNS